MKIYVHVSERAFICHLDPTSKIELLLEQVARGYESKTGSRLAINEFKLEDKYHKAVPLNKKASLVLSEDVDLFLFKGEEPVAKPKPKDVPKSTSKPEIDQNTRLLVDTIARGEKAEAESHYRTASDLYAWILRKCPNHKQALIRIIDLWRKVKRPEEAEEWCEAALKFYPDDLAILITVGRCKETSGDYRSAVQVLNKALEIAIKKPSPDFPLKDVQIYAANAMYAVGGPLENQAVQLVMSVVEPERSHFEGLLLYSKIAFNRGLTEDAARVLLRLIMQQNEHEEAKKYLAECFEKEETLEVVMRELKSGTGIASAFAFLAARIKDYGAIKPATRLYEKAVEIEPGDPSIQLNYIHTLELDLEIGKIMENVRKFLGACKVSLLENLDCKDILRLLTDLKLVPQGSLYGWLGSEAWKPHQKGEDVEDIVEKTEFSEIQLDLIALLFTLVKVLYVEGAVERAYQATHLIKLCSSATQKPFHKTTIRNEAAYFNCVRQILDEYPPPEIKLEDEINPIFLCGDSHCLSAAWQKVTLCGQERLLVPKLVTGCKVWHLRQESKFYPKHGFERTMKSLPDKSSVIFNFGEIDCRTGIGLAVEKCKYDSQEEAIKKTVSIYVGVIKDIVRTRDFVVYVHPVPPALDITRPMVVAYNEVLKESIANLSQNKSFKGKVFWLDFFDDLVSPDKKQLKPEFKFDDTHLAPSYVSLLRESLSQL